MKILLTGATGFIGHHLLATLIQAGHQVTACVRNPAKLAQLVDDIDFLTMDYSTAHKVADWLPYVQEVDVVINAVGIIGQTSRQRFSALHTDSPVALFTACEQAGVPRIVQISALGADATASTEYHQSKYAADDVLTQMNLHWFIICPSIVLGEHGKSLGLFNALANLPCIPVINGGRQRIQPIVIDDLVAVVMRCLDTQQPGQLIIDAVGSEPIAFADLLQQLRQWQGKAKGRLFSIPLSVAYRLLPLARLLDEPALNKETLRMLESGNTADAAGITRFLGKAPQGVSDYLLAHPASQAQRWHSRLYFLRPLLRLSIALLWIWTGVVSAFLYPQQDSYALLRQVGISGLMLPVLLYGAAAIDSLLGLALLLKKCLPQVVYVQTAVIVFYTLIITLALPEYWFHPYGPVSKNIPLLVATWVLLAMERP